MNDNTRAKSEAADLDEYLDRLGAPREANGAGELTLMGRVAEMRDALVAAHDRRVAELTHRRYDNSASASAEAFDWKRPILERLRTEADAIGRPCDEARFLDDAADEIDRLTAALAAQAEAHDRRVTELLEANNREVERRRQAEAQRAINAEQVRHLAETCRQQQAMIAGPSLALPEFLEWIADRLVYVVHGGDPNVDYVISLRERAKRVRATMATGDGWGPVKGGYK